MRTIVHLINLFSCIPLNADVAKNVWSGKDVSYNHPRLFRCHEFAHILDAERSKFLASFLDGK